MKFDIEKLKKVSRSMSQSEQLEIKARNENREWLALSAKFALLVRHILRKENMTQTELASRMGVSPVQVTKLLSGKENIGLQTISKVEKALDRSLVTFGDNAETSVFTPAQTVYKQIFTFPVCYSQAESSAITTFKSDSFTGLSTGTLLV